MLIEVEKVNVTKSKIVEMPASLRRAGRNFLPGARPCPRSTPRSAGRARRARHGHGTAGHTDGGTPGQQNTGIQGHTGAAVRSAGCDFKRPHGPGFLPGAAVGYPGLLLTGMPMIGRAVAGAGRGEAARFPAGECG